MPITDLQVSQRYDEIVNAPHGRAAQEIVNACTPTMIRKLADLLHAPEGNGPTANRDHILRDAGWTRYDETPRDGRGPCANGFSAHSRRPWQCRHCTRHRDDHAVTDVAFLVSEGYFS